MRTAAVFGGVGQSVIDAAGGKSGPYEGAYVTGWYPGVSDPRWDGTKDGVKNGMKRAIDEHTFGDHRIDPEDAGVRTAWIACTVLRAVLEGIGDGEVSAGTVRRGRRRTRTSTDRSAPPRLGRPASPLGRCHSSVGWRWVRPYVCAIGFHSWAALAFCTLATPLSRLPARVWFVMRAPPFLQPFLPAVWSAQAA